VRREPVEGKDFAICPHCKVRTSPGSRACRTCWRGGLANQRKYATKIPAGRPAIEVDAKFREGT
jgi:hypothetical protein